MKNLFLLLVLIINIILLHNCDGDPVDEIEGIRRIVNATDYYIDIKIYNIDSDTIKYLINPDDTLDIDGKCYVGGGEEYCSIGWDDMELGSVTFDNERIQKFQVSDPLYCTVKAINSSVWHSCSYELVEDTPTLQVFEYKIIQSDYDNAEIL